MNNQLELFAKDGSEHLFPYWRDSLRQWVNEVRFYRGAWNSTGWSMATQGYSFAQLLFRHGQMTRKELRRWFRFHRRVKRLDRVHFHQANNDLTGPLKPEKGNNE